MTACVKTMAVLLAILAIATEVPAIEIEFQGQNTSRQEAARHAELTCAIRPVAPYRAVPRSVTCEPSTFTKSAIIDVPAAAAARDPQYCSLHGPRVVATALLSLCCLLTI